MFAASAFTRRNFAHETGFCWLGFRGPDCNVIAEKGGGPDARPSWAGSGPRAGVARLWISASQYSGT